MRSGSPLVEFGSGSPECPAGPTSDLSWYRHAACAGADPDLFFADSRREPRLVAQAKTFCGGCLAATHCLAYALEHGMDGVWGGTTTRERRRMRRPSNRIPGSIRDQIRRAAPGLTTSELAAEWGVHRRTISRILAEESAS